MTSWTVVGRGMAPVAVAASRKQAKRFSDQYDTAMAGRASGKTLAKVVARVQEAHGVTGVVKARRPKPGPRCKSCGRFNKVVGGRFCARCGTSLSGKVGAAAKSAPPVGMSAQERERLAAVVRKATQSPDSNERAAAIGKLMQAVGREATAMVLTGAMSPQQFTRAYLSQHRAPLSAPAGQSPRVPQARAISSDDFRRPALSAGHQRPSQLLDRLNALMEPGGGQAVGYRSSPGIAPRDPYEPSSGQPNSSTVAPGLARANAARGAFSNPPMPGDARPW